MGGQVSRPSDMHRRDAEEATRTVTTREAAPAADPQPATESDPSRSRNGLLTFSALLLFKVTIARAILFNVLDLGKAVLVELGFLLAMMILLEVLFWRRRTLAFVVLDTVLTVLLGAVIVYHAYADRIATFELLALLGQVPDVQRSVVALLRPGLALVFVDILWLGQLLIRRKDPFRAPRTSTRALVRFGAIAAAMIAFSLLVGPQVDTSDTVAAAEARGLFAFQIQHALAGLTTPQSAAAADVDLTDPRAVQNRVKQLRDPAGHTAGHRFCGSAEGRHVFFIQVESMQSFAVGLSVAGKSVTPVMDGLRAESFYFPRVVQQIGAGNTSDCEFVTNTSLYPLESKAVSLEYGDRAFPSLPRLLSERGYSTATLHANEATFWNRHELYPALGFDRYYDIEFFKGGEVIGMGPSDEVLFERSLDAIDELSGGETPVYASMITLTTHHPFVMPEEDDLDGLPAEVEGTLVGDYLSSMHFIDGQIGSFIDGLKRRGIFDESVIVIFGDHFGLQLDTMTQADREAIRTVLGREYTVVDRLTVPLLVVAPGIADGRTVAITAGQVDVMPTVANLLGIPLDEYVHMGQDLLNPGLSLIGMRYYMETGTFADDNILYIPRSGEGQPEVYSMSSGAAAPEDGSAEDTSQRVRDLQSLSDSYIDSLSRR